MKNFVERSADLFRQMIRQIRSFVTARTSSKGTLKLRAPLKLPEGGDGDGVGATGKRRAPKPRLQHPIIDHYPVAILAGAAGLSALIYLLVFVNSFNLAGRYDQPLLDLYQVSKSDPLIVWKVVAAFVMVGVLYWLAWRAAQRARGRAAWFVVIGGALLLSSLMLFVFPYDAADVFDNIMRGRITSLYGMNPFQDTPHYFWTDPFYPYVAWKSRTSIYGPAWEGLAGLTTRLGGDGVVANVLAFKLVLVAFLAGSVTTAAAILRRIAPDRALAGVVFLAWNPLILHEVIGNGHNDIAMIFWVLLGAWWLLNRRYTLAVLALVMGALFKYIPVLMLPAMGLIALRDLAMTRARLRFLISAIAGSSVLILLALVPFGYGANNLTLDLHARLFSSSLPAAIYTALQPSLSEEAAAQVVSGAAVGLTVIFALWQAIRAWRDHSALSFTRSAFYILMFYLMFTGPWFQHWYAVWPLALAALLPPDRSVRLANVFGVAAWAKFFVVGPLVLWVLQVPFTNSLELWFGPLVMVVPWTYTLYALWRSWQETRRTQLARAPAQPIA